MKPFSKGSIALTNDPFDMLVPGHRFHGRICKIVGIVDKNNEIINIEYEWKLGDKFIGKFLHVTIIKADRFLLPIFSQNKLLKLANR